MTARADAAPESNFPVRVLRVPKSTSIAVLFLGELRGSLEHWLPGGSQPCLHAECPAAWHKQAVTFSAYSPALYFDAPTQLWYPCVFQATSSVEEELRGEVLRGRKFRFFRTPAKKNKPGQVKFEELAGCSADQIPVGFDVAPVLRRLWKQPTVYLDVPNPTPGRVFLPAISLKDGVHDEAIRQSQEPEETEAEWVSFKERRRQILSAKAQRKTDGG